MKHRGFTIATRQDIRALIDKHLALKDAAERVIMDRMQDRLEDPCGASDREPYCRIHNAAIDGLAVAVGAHPARDGKGDDRG